MKHRSVIAFILLAAALFAAPQISNDLSNLKSALGARIRGEILHAYLNLRASDGANELVTRRANTQLASYQAKDKACAQPASTTKKSNGREPNAPRSETTARTHASAQLAMLVSLSLGSEISKAVFSNAETRAAIGEVAALPQSDFAQGDLAMLNPPDSGAELPSFADALTGSADEKDAARQWQQSAETQRRMAFVAAGFEKHGAQKVAEEMIHHISSTLTDADMVRMAEKGMRVKVLKLRRAGRDGFGNSKTGRSQPVKVNAPQAVPVAALVPPDLAPCAPACAISSE